MSRDIMTDVSLGGAAVTLPLWLQHIAVWAQAFVLIGGAVLLALRLVLTVRDLRQKEGAGDGNHHDQD